VSRPFRWRERPPASAGLLVGLLSGSRVPWQSPVGAAGSRPPAAATDADIWLGCYVRFLERPTEEAVPTGEDLAFAGVERLSELLRAKQVTPRELVEFYLERIERLDPRPPDTSSRTQHD
jgi:hypothetical protein